MQIFLFSSNHDTSRKIQSYLYNNHCFCLFGNYFWYRRIKQRVDKRLFEIFLKLTSYSLLYSTGYTNQWCKKVNCTCTAKNPNNCTFKDDNLLYFMTQTSEPVVYKSYQYICRIHFCSPSYASSNFSLAPDYFDCWTTPINSTDVALLLREPQATSTLILFEFSLLFCGTSFLSPFSWKILFHT